MEPLILQTPSADHVQFDQICAEIDEFEHLPAVLSAALELDQGSDGEPEFDEQILAGLVTPVY